jgi:hypothetical protein
MPERTHRNDRLVRIATAPNEIVAELWKGLLAEEGIHALIKPIGPGSAYFTNFSNQHAVLVLEKDAELATEILGSPDEMVSSDDDESSDD